MRTSWPVLFCALRRCVHSAARSLRLGAALASLAALALASTAQAFIDLPMVKPAEPTDATPVSLTLRYGECDALLSHEVEQTGSIAVTIVKETRETPFCDVPEGVYEIALGLLSPGNHQFRIYLRDSEPPDAPLMHFHSGAFDVTGSIAYFSDLEVALIATPSVDMPPGTQGRVTARFINHGPDVTDHVVAVTPHVVHFGPTIPYEIYLGPFTGCNVWFSTLDPQPGQPLAATMVFNLDDEPLQVGETRDCTIGFNSRPTAAGTFTLQVVVNHATPLNYTDPEPGNNQAELRFVFGDTPAPAAPVPTFSRLGFPLLLACFLLAYLLRGRHA